MKSFWIISFILTGTLIACNSVQPNDKSGGSKTIVVQNYYYAKPGKAEEVLAWRIHACDVLEQIGVRRGRVLKCIAKQFSDVTERIQPDVIWTVEYPDSASLSASRKLVDQSKEFDTVMEHMGTLILDFNRMQSIVQ